MVLLRRRRRHFREETRNVAAARRAPARRAARIRAARSPARNDIEPEDPARSRPLERLRVVELQRNVAEQQSRTHARAHAWNAIGSVGLEAHSRRLAFRPCEAGIAEEEQLRRKESGCQTKLL